MNSSSVRGGAWRDKGENVKRCTHQRRVEVRGLKLVLLSIVVRVRRPVCMCAGPATCMCNGKRAAYDQQPHSQNIASTRASMHAPDVAQVCELKALVRLDGGAPARGRPAEESRGGLLLPRAVC